jgi:nitrogen fixation NifU-like protein
MPVSEDKMKAYQKVIIDHFRSPANFRVIDNPDAQALKSNRLCGDRVCLQIKLSDRERLEEVAFSEESCSVCKASASMLTQLLNGLSKTEALDALDALDQFASDWQLNSTLGEFEAFVAIKDFKTRHRCLCLPWQAARDALEQIR